MHGRTVRLLAALISALCLATAICTAPASAASVKITSGNGSKAHPYNFRVVQNKNGVVVRQVTHIYSTDAGDLFTMTERTVMTNKTTRHVGGDDSVSKMSTQYLYGCSTPGGIHEKCQRVLFIPQHGLNGQGVNKTKLGNAVDCTATAKNFCSTRGWVTRYGWEWDNEGGFWTSDYPYPEWQASVNDLHVKINGYWIKCNHDTAMVLPWVKATLHT